MSSVVMKGGGMYLGRRGVGGYMLEREKRQAFLSMVQAES